MKRNSFANWKRKYLKDRVCKSTDEVVLWLEMHDIYGVPDIVRKYNRWACKKSTRVPVCLQRYKFIICVKGFLKPYYRTVISLSPIDFLIKKEYFKIFGNTCKIRSKDIRTIDRYFDLGILVRFTTITTYVESLYNEERSGQKISNFYLQTKRRRDSWPDSNKIKQDRFSKGRSERKKRKLSLSDLMDKYRWSTEAYHKKLVKYFTDNITKNVDEPRLVLMFGIPGSGKNWVLDKRRKRNHVVINIDDCLAMLPDYWRGMLELQEKDKNAHDWIKMFRKECHAIVELLFKYAVKHRMNIVWNGTGKNMTKYLNLIHSVKRNGYIIDLNGIWSPIDMARKRVRERRNSYGRAVPEEIITMAAANIPASFKNLRYDADYARIWKNSSTSSPRILWDKQQGWVENDEKMRRSGWISPPRH